MAPESMHTMIVSGDVLIRTNKRPTVVPEADVVCYGLWLDDEVATAHGVFVAERKHPTTLKCMLQKPSVETLKNLIRVEPLLHVASRNDGTARMENLDEGGHARPLYADKMKMHAANGKRHACRTC